MSKPPDFPESAKKFPTKRTPVNFPKLIKQVESIIRKNDLSYEQTKYVISEARKLCGLKPEKVVKKKLPELPSVEQVEQLLKAAESNYTHWLMIKLLLSTGIRVSELININIQDVYVEERKIFIREGKTGDRYVLYPIHLKMHLINIMQNRKEHYSLFVSNRGKGYSRVGVWKFINRYANKAGISRRMHPHVFRHLFCSRMSCVMNEAELMVLSGHTHKETLGIYQHLSVDDLKDKYALANP